MKLVTLKAQSDWLEKRKAELGYAGNAFVMLNSGRRRSASKRALLRKLARLRAANPNALQFDAKF